MPMPSVHQILIGLALLLAILSLIKPTWPLLSVSVLLIAVDLLIKGG